ncbi:MAG: ribonuclease E/G [Cellulosilyticaceae bacterium]
MKKQIIVEQSVVLTRIALIIDGVCKQMYAQQAFNPTGQSKVVQGQIEKMVPHLKAAFVNFGEDKNGLLHLNKIPECYDKRVQQGLRLPVQVIKENTGDKGHKLSAYINIPGYYLVCLPFENTINISKKISDPQKRKELKELITHVREDDFGFILRTNSQDVPYDVLEVEARQLMLQAKRLMKYKDTLTKGEVLLEEDPLVIQLMRDWITPSDELEVICNDKEMMHKIQQHMALYLPQVLSQYRSYPKEEHLFAVFGIDKIFEQALRKKVWLKNGGNLVIEATEAMTVVDVNSAKAIQKKNVDKAVREMNELAISETIRQMVYRNIAGIVMVDLIDIKSKQLKDELYEFAKKQAVLIDGSRTRVFPISELDLLQMSREKKYPKLAEVMLESCKQCGERQMQQGKYYQTFEIEQQIKRVALQTIQKNLYLKCGSQLAAFWKENGLIKVYQEVYGITIHLIVDNENEKYTLNHHI